MQTFADEFPPMCSISLLPKVLTEKTLLCYLTSSLYREGRSGAVGGSDCKKIGDVLLHAFDLAAVDHYGRKVFQSFGKGQYNVRYDFHLTLQFC